MEEVETQLIERKHAKCSNICGYGEGKNEKGS